MYKLLNMVQELQSYYLGPGLSPGILRTDQTLNSSNGRSGFYFRHGQGIFLSVTATRRALGPT
jgi:hypothetical protein